MKSIIIAMAILATITGGAKAQEYQLHGVVADITPDEITVHTDDGNGWAIDREDGYTIGNDLIITFDDMGTATIYDDEIISISPTDEP